MLPWDEHPALTKPRLMLIAQTIASVRRDAADAHEPEKGDSSWGFGARSHERQMKAITQLAATYDWLTIIDPSLHFVFAIGPVVFRFYRGDPNRPPRRSLLENFPETTARQGVLGFSSATAADTGPSLEYLWRLAVETHENGTASQIAIIKVNKQSESVEGRYDVPFDTEPTFVASVEAIQQREGRQLQPPTVSLKSDDRAVSDGEQ